MAKERKYADREAYRKAMKEKAEAYYHDLYSSKSTNCSFKNIIDGIEGAFWRKTYRTPEKRLEALARKLEKLDYRIDDENSIEDTRYALNNLRKLKIEGNEEKINELETKLRVANNEARKAYYRTKDIDNVSTKSGFLEFDKKALTYANTQTETDVVPVVESTFADWDNRITKYLTSQKKEAVVSKVPVDEVTFADLDVADYRKDNGYKTVSNVPAKSNVPILEAVVVASDNEGVTRLDNLEEEALNKAQKYLEMNYGHNTVYLFNNNPKKKKRSNWNRFEDWVHRGVLATAAFTALCLLGSYSIVKNRDIIMPQIPAYAATYDIPQPSEVIKVHLPETEAVPVIEQANQNDSVIQDTLVMRIQNPEKIKLSMAYTKGEWDKTYERMKTLENVIMTEKAKSAFFPRLGITLTKGKTFKYPDLN